MVLTNLESRLAPGAPGMEPRWTSAGKEGAGTAMSPHCPVWFTLSHGIVNEVYYPYMDQANIRDMGLIITDGEGYFCEEKRHMTHEIEWVEKGVPAYKITNTCKQGRCRITKWVYCDPFRPAFVMKVKFEALVGKLSDYHCHVLLAPHVRNCGYGNDAWIDDVKGYEMLFARRHGTGLALGCSAPWLGRSCGYVGTSDGWQDLHKNGRMTKFYTEAPEGNVALTGEVDLNACEGEFRLVVGFGRGRAESSQVVRGTLVAKHEYIYDAYLDGWRDVQKKYANLGAGDEDLSIMYRTSISVLESHRSKSQMGSMTASLAIPWGDSKGDNDLGGYHLVWPRDQALSSGGFLAAGDPETARDVLLWLQANQEADGHWAQNMWDDGTPYWQAIQIDETALPILFADALKRMGRLPATIGLDDMVKKAANFILRQGPVTEQDRWEEDGGYTPFSIAAEIAALLATADTYETEGKFKQAEYLREIADCWNDSIERWLYASGSPLAKKLDVDGYYVRVSPEELCDGCSPIEGYVPVRNRPDGHNILAAQEMVSIDALALVRFGLRDAHDPRILNTIKVIDAVLKKETTTGPTWHRYNEDGYGEHPDGRAFDGTGLGRGWPLIVGERGHYEIAAGNFEEARRLLFVMIAQSGVGGFLPEQIWESEDIPEHRLYNGKPSGSAMPLVWAHSEFIKLLRSFHAREVFDMPPQTVQRYLKDKAVSPHFMWRFNQKITKMPQGKQLRIQLNSPARIKWKIDDGSEQETEAQDTGLTVYYLDLPTEQLKKGSKITFTFYWNEVGAWEGQEYSIVVD